MTEFERIYRDYFREVELYLRAVCKEEVLAEELTEQTFFQAMKELPKFRGDCDVRTWLCAIGRNCYLSHLRRNKPQANLDELQIPDPRKSMEEQLVDKTQALAIHRILHDLPEPYKEVFSLRVFGQLSFEDIGSLFGRTANWAYTVSTRYCFVNEQGGLYISYTPELEDQVQEQWGPYTQTDHNYDLWYVDGDGTMTLLWGGGDGETNPDVAISGRNDVAFLYLAAFLASVLVAAAAFLGIRFLPNPRLKPHLRILGTVAASLSAALLIVSGFDLTDPTGQRFYFWGQHLLSVTVLLAVTALLWQWLHAMDKQR